MRHITLLLGAASALAFAAAANAQAITIATVNNGDMIRMQGADLRSSTTRIPTSPSTG